ncbi:MAG: TonB-dependent receptor [Culturomica sp.]|jgi:TonB-linked SusC/RagA family outer membrane protein|nr:TonB-dependent receptor [Culturomica sp.]
MRKLLVSTIAVLFASFQLVMAQTQINGTVTDGTGAPLPGVSVKVKGTSTGTATHVDGTYSLNVASDATIEFSFMGFKTQEIAVNGKTTINVTMVESSELLDEVVVTGSYGTGRALSSMTGAVSAVRSDKLKDRPIANAADALQGQVAGLQVFMSSGEPSADFTMRLRGVNSINAGNTPLLLMDGIPVTSSAFNAINANDIESIVVLKDASATAIYGSRAANGVLIVTTKKGNASSKPILQVKAQYGVSALAEDNLPMMGGLEYLNFKELVDPTLVSNQSFQEHKAFVEKYNINTNWRDFLFKSNSPVYEVNASATGKEGRTSYFISAGYLNQDGITHHSSMDRMNLRTNLVTELSKYVKVGVNIGLSHQRYRTTFSTSNGWYNPANYARWADPSYSPYTYTIEGDKLVYGEPWVFSEEMGLYNAKSVMEGQPAVRKTSRIIGGSFIEITPIEGLTIKSSQAMDAFDYLYDRKVYPSGILGPTGTRSKLPQRYYSFTFTNTAEYKYTFKEDHNFTLLAGQESIIQKTDFFQVTAAGQTDDRLLQLRPGGTVTIADEKLTETVFNSYFGRIEYNYQEKYFIDLSLRTDGSSRFAPDARWGTFYSVGLLWDAKKENFMSNVNFVDDLKVRLSYGSTGNSSIDDYLYIGSLSSTSRYNTVPATTLGTVPNNDLTWETVTTFNLGLQARLMKNLNVELDFYKKTTSDMLLSVPYSLTTGHDSGYGNVGEMTNTGIDAQVSYNIFNRSDLSWTVSANFNYNKNEITKLYEGIDEFESAGTGLKFQEGHAYGEFYYAKYAGVNPANGEQLWYTPEGNVTNVYSENLKVFTGKQRFAPFAGGFSTQFMWKGLGVFADFSWVLNKYSVNNDRYFVENSANATDQNMSKSMHRMWTTPGQITDIPRAGQRPEFDSRFLENASFGRLKNLTISYDLPKNILDKTGFLGGARVYVTGRNLLTLTDYSGFDPEVDSNLQLGNYPNTKQYQVGIELTF